MLTTLMLEGIRDQIEAMVDHVKYTANGEDIDADISVLLLEDGRLAVTFQTHNPEETITVSQVRLYDASGDLLATKNENIILQPGQGVLYRFAFEIQEK